MSSYARRLGAPWRLELGVQVRLVTALAVAAWVAGVWLWLDRTGAPASAGASRWWCMPGMAGGGASADPLPGSSGVPMWLLMTLAMSLPGELPAAEYVATNSFARRRSSSVTVFVVVYLAVWLCCGLAILTLAPLLGGLAPGVLFATALVLAAGYELTPLKRRALNRCHRGAALPPSGARRVARVARFGWINGSGCVGSCWPAMLSASIAPVAQPLAMSGFTLAMTYERLTRRPQTARRRIASSYLLLAALFIVAAF
ncbi:MAG: copper chaperone [Solirubrobacteraceae bacterium]